VKNSVQVGKNIEYCEECQLKKD